MFLYFPYSWNSQQRLRKSNSSSKKVIPEIISGFNIIAHSWTNLGKTASFLLPTLHKLKSHSQFIGAHCLILSPVRKISYQTVVLQKIRKIHSFKIFFNFRWKKFWWTIWKIYYESRYYNSTTRRVLHHIEEGSL